MKKKKNILLENSLLLEKVYLKNVYQKKLKNQLQKRNPNLY